MQILEDKVQPKNGSAFWLEEAHADNGCIYYMPYGAKQILKLDTHDGDNLSLQVTI